MNTAVCTLRSPAATDPRRGVQTRDSSKHGLMTSDGVEIAVTDYRPSGPISHTVVLLHGLCLSRRSWYLTYRRLCQPGVRVIAYDHRGHGQSGSAALATYTPQRLAQDLAELLTALNVVGPLTIAGHSMGGMSALRYLAGSLNDQPVRPNALVLVGTSAGGLTECGLGRLLGTPGLGALIEVATRAPRALGERAVRALAQPLCGLVTHDASVTKSLAEALGRTPMRTSLGFLQALKVFDQRTILPSISARTTVISGGRDILTPPTHSDHMAALIPNATHLHLPDAGHMLLQEAADIVTGAILRTITDAESIGAPA